MNGAESRPIYTYLQADLSPKDGIGQMSYFVFTSGKTWNHLAAGDHPLPAPDK